MSDRPFFNRKEGELGMYLTVYDAKAEDPKSYGSEHFYIMDLTDRLSDVYRAMDIVKVKQGFTKKRVFQGAYVERFEKGLIIVVGFDDIDALEAVWKLYTDNRLKSIVNDVMITSPVLKQLGAVKITLQAKVVEDEYKQCKNELLSRKMERMNIKTLGYDQAVLKRIKAYQEKLSKSVTDIREVENNIEKSIGEFLTTMKQVVPPEVRTINTLKEFDTFVKMSKGVQKRTGASVDRFCDTLKKWRAFFAEVEENVCHPICAIHRVCENESQQENKEKILKTVKEAQDLLKPEVNLQKVRHVNWQRKVLQLEQGLYCGLICIIPLCASAAVDISVMVDEYLTDFPLEAYE